jgi:hypothetical protein
MICGFCGDHFENVGKQPLQQSGKYRVNENDEENFASVFLPASFRGDADASNYDVQLHIREPRDSPMRNCASEVWC